MHSNKICIAIIVSVLQTGCGDKAQRHLYDKSYKSGSVSCMRLQVTPYDKKMESILRQYYNFSTKCPYVLQVEHKNGIICNSSYNAPQKALTNFPNSYLKLELHKGLSLLYSYYIDLDHKPDESDISEGMDRLERDLGIAP